MAKSDQGYMMQLREPHERPPRRTSTHEERRSVMIFAVVGTMAFIVALWVMVIPIQVSGLKIGGLKQAVTGSVTVQESAAEQWDELMTGASERLQQTTSSVEAQAAKINAPAAANVSAVGTLDAASLTAKLQAANANATATAPTAIAPTSSR